MSKEVEEKEGQIVRFKGQEKGGSQIKKNCRGRTGGEDPDEHPLHPMWYK